LCISFRHSLAERIITSRGQDAGIPVCALVVVIASATSKWFSLAEWIIISFRLLAHIIFGAICVVIARPSSHKLSTAFKGCRKVTILTWKFATHVPISAFVVIIAGLPWYQRAAAPNTLIKDEAGSDCHTQIVDGAFTVVIAGHSNDNIPLAHRHVPLIR
jgi:hypothetical protein